MNTLILLLRPHLLWSQSIRPPLCQAKPSLRHLKLLGMLVHRQVLLHSLYVLLRLSLLILAMLLCSSWLTGCSSATVQPSQVTRVVPVPAGLLVDCKGEAPPTGAQLLSAQTQYPVYQKYAAEDAQWQEYLKTLPAEQANKIQSLIQRSHAWEARFLMMSDKYMAQTDYLGLCNGRFKTIDQWSKDAQAAALKAGGSP